MKTRLLILGAALALFGCKGEMGVGSPAQMANSTPSMEEPTETPQETNPTDAQTESATDPTPTTDDENETPQTETVVEIPDFSAQELVPYMRSISQMLVSRQLTSEEVAAIEADEEEALEGIIRGWATESAFADNARYMMQQKLKASGERDGIDFELPGNLVRHVVVNDLPWETVLTADYCVDSAGGQTECDTGAPYSAGVLATRAYLAGNASRFNLGRANRLMNVFACRIYPMESQLQPYLDKTDLIPMFQANTAEEQTVEEAAGGFGNGSGCYSCHGQFGAHAQLFVKYDESGMYVPDADGQQDPDGELGRSVNGLMTSHMIEPEEAASEQTQMFGKTVADLSEAAQVLAESSAFLPCQARNIINHTFGLSESTQIDREMLLDIGAEAREENPQPTYADLVVTTFTEPRVILSYVDAFSDGGTQ